MNKMLTLIMVGWVLLAVSSPATANVSIPAGELAQRTRYVFEMKDSEGREHTVYILATNEKRLPPGSGSWFRTTDRVFRGNYFAAVLTADGKNATLQNLALFGFGNRDSTLGTINASGDDYKNKAYVVRATGDNEPDLLIVAQQVTGGGDANIRAFFIDEGALCLVYWQNQYGQAGDADKFTNVDGLKAVEPVGKMTYQTQSRARGPKNSGVEQTIWKFEKSKRMMMGESEVD